MHNGDVLHIRRFLQRVLNVPNGRFGAPKWLPGGHFRRKFKKFQIIPNDSWTPLDPKYTSFSSRILADRVYRDLLNMAHTNGMVRPQK